MALYPGLEVGVKAIGPGGTALALQCLVDRALGIALEGEGRLGAMPAWLRITGLPLRVDERATQTTRPLS
jgi:hypothetical protein